MLMSRWRSATLVLLLTLLVFAVPVAGSNSARALSDGVLRVPLPRGWSGGLGRGVERGQPVSWMMVGNFAFAADYPATHEGTPTVPSGKLLIVLGDFIVVGPARHWPSARRLRVPSKPRRLSNVSWNVRFAGRALRLSVHFGSRPTPATIVLANRILTGVRHA
jgi:hypothetical protein